MRTAIILTALITLVRLALIALVPYDLVGDEAHYWDWSRHLDWSYYSKGPGVAWAIAISTALLGDTEFAVRLPTVLASGCTLLCVAWLARRLYPSARNAPATAVLALAGVPIIHGIALLMTIDGPYVACWAWALCVAWRIAEQAHHSHDITRARMTTHGIHLGIAIGIGFLFKYTILLLVPALLLFVLLSKRWATRSRRTDAGSTPMRAWVHAAIPACIAYVVCAMPVVWWNIANGSPTVKHLMGHLGLRGGDMPVSAPSTASGGDPWTPLITLEYFGTQVGLIGPVLVLAFVSSIATIRRLIRTPSHDRCVSDLFLLCTGWTIFLVYLGVSFRTNVEGNWPVAGVAALSVLVGRDAATVLRRHTRRIRAWDALPLPKPKHGILRKKPESAYQIGCHWGIAYGLGSLVLFAALPIAARLPGIGNFIPLSRIEGASERAAVVQTHLDTLRNAGHEPIVIATEYWLASHLAFYLDGKPTVFSATAYRGGRKSSYDYFDATDMTAPALVGRPALLVSTHKNEHPLERERWERSQLILPTIELLEEGGRALDRPTVLYAPVYGGVLDVDADTRDTTAP